MNRNDLYRSFGEVDDEVLERSEAPQEAKTSSSWRKWAAIAASICLLAGMMLFSDSIFSPRSNETIPVVLYNGSQYGICGSKGEGQILKKCGLPSILDETIAGEFIGYLKKSGNQYVIADHEQPVKMYQYAPSPNDEVYIVQIDGTFYAAILWDEGFTGTVPAATLRHIGVPVRLFAAGPN